jgi:2-polyprenyl-3-methyl-5-hydroxy-6-metoxy-1,4-benzoquinol methylase
MVSTSLSSGSTKFSKPKRYYAGARRDIVELLPPDPAARVLEIGCGNGDTGAAVLAANKAHHYAGIDLDAGACDTARQRLSHVVKGDLETIDVRAAVGGDFDVVIASEVLEHLVDPWSVVARLVDSLRPGGLLVASSPNVASRRIIRNLISGRFEYARSGPMDSTHLRWFTPASYRAMFEAAGLETLRVGPVATPGRRFRLVNRLTRGRFDHLFMTQILYVGRKPATPA